MAGDASGEAQLYEQNSVSLNTHMSDDDYMKAELEAENELLILQGLDDDGDDLNMPIMNIKSEPDIKTEPDNKQVNHDTHREPIKKTGGGQLPATKTNNQGTGEIKKVQFTDVKIVNNQEMLKDLTTEKQLKMVFAYPIHPRDMTHPIMADICKLCSSFTVNFHSTEVKDSEQMIGILVMKLHYYETLKFVLENIVNINKDLNIGVKTSKVNYFTDFHSKYGLAVSKKPEYNTWGYLYVANVPSSATEEELAALFPGAKIVVLARDINGLPKGYGYVNYETEDAAKDALYNHLTFPMVLHQHQLVVYYYSDPVSHRRQVSMKLPNKMKVPPPHTPKGRGMSDEEKERMKKQLLDMRHEISQVRGVNEARRQEIGRKMQVIERKLASEKGSQPQQKPQERPQEKSQRKPQQKPQEQPPRKPQESPRQPRQTMPSRPLLHTTSEGHRQPPLLREPPLLRRPQQPHIDEPVWAKRGRSGTMRERGGVVRGRGSVVHGRGGPMRGRGSLKRQAEPPGGGHPMSSYASSYIAMYGNDQQNTYDDETEPPPKQQPRWAEPQPPQVPSLLSVEPNYPDRGRPVQPWYPPMQEKPYMPYEREPETDGATDAVNLLLGITEVLRQQTGLSRPMPARHCYDGYGNEQY